MKFGLFSEIQIPKPVDGEDWEEGQEARVISEVLEQIEFADSLGFDYVFMVEHHFAHEYSHSSAPEVLLGSLARRTSRIRLGTGITHMLPPVNHPARVAERIATLDVISRGRVEFGTGSGATEGEITPFGVPYGEKHDMWREATEQCLNMLASDPYPGHEGRFTSMPSRQVLPRPLQRPHPPVWMAARTVGDVRHAASLGMGMLGISLDTVEATREKVDQYWDAIRTCDAPIGHCLNPAITSVAHLMCAPTTEEAFSKGKPGADFFTYAISRYNRDVVDNIHREFQRVRAERPEKVGTVTAEDLQRSGVHLPPEAVQDLVRMLNADAFFNSSKGLFGTPEQIRKRVRAYEEAHVDVLIFLVQAGDRAHEDIMASLDLFGREVLPEFKERHPKHVAWRAQRLDGLRHPVFSSVDIVN